MTGVRAHPDWALAWIQALLIGGGPLLDGPACAAQPDAGLWRDRLQALLDDRFEDLAGADAALCAATGLQPSADAELWRAVRQALRAEAAAELKWREATAAARAPLLKGNAAKTADADVRVARVARAAIAAQLTADATDAELRAAAGIAPITGRRYAYPVPGAEPIVRGKDAHIRDLAAVRERLKAREK